MASTSVLDPKSIVSRSTHIVLVKVTAAKAGAWTPAQPGLKSRLVELTVQILKTFRGKLDPLPTNPVQIKIVQGGYASELMMQPLPGIWSGLELEPGNEFVIYARAKESRIEDLLVEPACIGITSAAAVLVGLNVMIKIEAEHLSLADALALAAAETPRIDPTFAEYLWDRYGGNSLAAQADFDLLMGFGERKGLDPTTRQAFLKRGYDVVCLYAESTPGRARRLALAMTRVLLMSEAADLHDNLVGTYLPNLLGLSSRLPAQPASAVFSGHEAEREALDAFLSQHAAKADALLLQNWLRAK